MTRQKGHQIVLQCPDCGARAGLEGIHPWCPRGQPPGHR